MLKKQFENLNKMAIMGVLLLFSACQDGLNESIEPEELSHQKILAKDHERDDIASQIAQNLASSLTNSEVRHFIKQKAIEQFDGDYNFLIETTKNEQISTSVNGRSTGLSFGEILGSGGFNASGRVNSNDLVNMVSSEHPLMQVSIPQLEEIDAESWDTDSHTPLVAFVPSDYDESSNTATIPAYDEQGNVFHLSVIDEPTELVVVVSDNESILPIEKSLVSNGRTEGFPVYEECAIMATPYHESETHLYYFKEDIYPIIDSCHSGGDSGRSGGSGGSSGSGNSCDRETKNSRDRLLKARFRSKSAIREVERWFWGKPEMYVLITTAKNPNGNPVFGSQRKWIGKEGWYHRKGLSRKLVIDMKTIDIPIFTWDDEVYGDQMVYTWLEEDHTIFKIDFEIQVESTFNVLDTQILNVTVNGNGTFRIFRGDDLSGHATVEYCNNTDGDGTRHVGGGVDFWVDQE